MWTSAFNSEKYLDSGIVHSIVYGLDAGPNTAVQIPALEKLIQVSTSWFHFLLMF